jgi:quercetin dioxygenase-like cupin family protein
MGKTSGATYFVIGLLAAAGAAAGQEAPAPRSTVLIRAATTITGQPIPPPAPGFEVVVSRTEIPAGGLLPMHHHPWPRYAIVEHGRLRVRYEEAGLERVFGPGEAVIEAIGQWHEGAVVGPEPVRLIVVDHVPPGETNMVRRAN